ncbi:hypothetical protein NSMM_230017 [Nitrosomonas mobilis]|uniref:Uncharacterized protein n=1 Tax=Nitrosomonas mobilis TaxID=51642 RepID=A0A1G5SBP9_9PROT|nr:hypothetical protein NSMM_230017 [Nitrosomonas mobilis]
MVQDNDDNTISASESQSLQEKLNHLGKPDELLFASLLDHSDLATNLEQFSKLDFWHAPLAHFLYAHNVCIKKHLTKLIVRCKGFVTKSISDALTLSET